MRTGGSSPEEIQALADLLVRRIDYLTYLACAICVKRALEQAGFLSVRLSDRMHLRGRTSSGGFDMEALVNTGLGLVPVLIQVKRSTRAVSRQAVDGLRGAMVRLEKPMGVIVTLGSFSRAAIKAAAGFPGRPIRLVDGKELGSLMVGARLGVVEERSITSGTLSLYYSEEPFELLTEFCGRVIENRRFLAKSQNRGARG